MSYFMGTAVRCRTDNPAFTNAAGTVADPTAVTFTFEDPDGNQTTYTYGVDSQLTRDATGIYKVDLLLSLSGAWKIRWLGTGAVAVAFESTINVPASVLV